MRVLIMDDNPVKASQMERTLMSMGITSVLWKKCGEDAIESIRTYSFDVMLLDMFFPMVKGGREVSWAGVKILDEMNKQDIHFPVIVTSTVRSSFMDYPDVIGQAQAGTDDFQLRIEELISQIPDLKPLHEEWR